MIHLIRLITTGTLGRGLPGNENRLRIMTMRARVPAKQDNVADVLLVIHESQSDRNLRAYSPLFIDNCLRKCIGGYLSCAPSGNGNLTIKCSTAQQIKTLLSSTSLSNGKAAVPVKASLLPPPSANGVIYRVPVEVKTGELMQALQAQHVKFVKRVQVTSADTTWGHGNCPTALLNYGDSRVSPSRLPNFQGPSVHTEANPLFQLQSLWSCK